MSEHGADDRRCVKDMLAEAVERIHGLEAGLACGMSPAKFAQFVGEADTIMTLMERCRERFIEKSQGE